jgi:glucose-6-phosphate-specific signal transduction histidine kinase
MTMFLFRAAQELLFNVVRHARVSEAALRVRRTERYVCLRVSDRGRGFDPQELRETPGLGLLSIRERVGLLGGRMQIKSTNGSRTAVRIVVPDNPPEDGKAQIPNPKQIHGRNDPNAVRLRRPCWACPYQF